MTFKRLFITLIIALLALSAGGFAYYLSILKQPLNVVANDNVVEIRKGEALYSVLSQLNERGVLPKERNWAAKVYLKIESHQGNDIARNIKAGEFLLQPGIAMPELFALLTSNRQISYSLTLVPGSTFKQVTALLSETLKLKSVLTGKTVQQIMNLVPLDASFKTFHPEGLFYPDTYRYHKGDTDLSILQRAHKRLVKVLNEEWMAKEKGLPLISAYEALILASIVEKETGKPSEREEIAGVFTRRLQKKMRLQTDPTVIYGLGDRYQGNITRKHLRELTPYNTYRINGLPPTPIALAGREAIHAALHPAKGETLYFVAKGDGSHQFSKTISEHNKAVREYQLKRRKDYRSTHQATN